MGKVLENVALMATSHNIAKAYISRLQREGFKPSKVIFLNFPKKEKLLFEKVRFAVRQNTLNELTKKIARRLYFGKQASDENSAAVKKLFEAVNNELRCCDIYSTALDKPVPKVLNDTGWDYEVVNPPHINDSKFISFLKKEVREQYVVFMGGGILRNEILSCGKRFIHIHPGIVPELKGADGILWSALVYKNIGMSIFFMNKGIDTGDIIKTKKYKIPEFDFNIAEFPPEIIKKIIISYVDPHYRADALVSLFKEQINPALWKIEKQNPNEGKTYYFMHNDLSSVAIDKFFIKKLN